MSRAYHLTLAFLVFNLVVLMMAQTGIFPTSVLSLDETFLTQSDLQAQVNSAQEDVGQSVGEGLLGDTLAGIRFFVSGVSIILNLIIKIPFALPVLISELGAPGLLVAVFYSVFAFVYIIAAVQFFTNRGMKDDE